jgi:AmmeMemoRadiSam system protein B
VGFKRSNNNSCRRPIEMNSKRYKREAEHGGSWYQSDPDDLNKDLSGYLQKAEIDQKISAKSPPIARGIIAPHAGFSYSGPTAGYAYNGLKSALEKGWQGTVLVLHPSHHVYLEGCAISGATSLETPLGDLSVDDSLRSELLNTGEFTVMDKETDENEHSGEMQYPFIAKTFLDSAVEASNLLVLPIMVGAISTAQEAHFGRVLSKFVARENVFTVISSDFCHWGARFGYTPTKPPGQIITSGSKEIYEYVSF